MDSVKKIADTIILSADDSKLLEAQTESVINFLQDLASAIKKKNFNFIPGIFKDIQDRIEKMKPITQRLVPKTAKVAVNTDTDIVNEIMAYEGGEMTQEEMIDFFGKIVSKGLHRTLQGHYGRTAADLIHGGYLSPSGKVLKYPE